MDYLDFIWDENKNKKNIASHNISFEEAKTVFFDPNAKVIYDPDHSKEEDRFVILGLSKFLNILVVCHCFKENDSIIRIISARKATSKERKQYGGK
ncbi:MAG: BrnT family toxin [Treponema sp.]|nr:BrnT family toxin [Treponema sp.]